MSKLFDFNHPFFRPLWIRVLIVASCLGWTAVEILGGSPGWAMLFGAVGLYAGYAFFFDFHPREPESKEPRP